MASFRYNTSLSMLKAYNKMYIHWDPKQLAKPGIVTAQVVSQEMLCRSKGLTPCALISLRGGNHAELNLSPSSQFKALFSSWIANDSRTNLSPPDEDLRSIVVSEKWTWCPSSKLWLARVALFYSSCAHWTEWCRSLVLQQIWSIMFNLKAMIEQEFCNT